jgi:hypothetical protein
MGKNTALPNGCQRILSEGSLRQDEAGVTGRKGKSAFMRYVSDICSVTRGKKHLRRKNGGAGMIFIDRISSFLTR